jgi:hypothetical protein
MYSKEKVLQMANYSGDLSTATISFGVDQKWQTSLTILPKTPKRLSEELKKQSKRSKNTTLKSDTETPRTF